VQERYPWTKTRQRIWLSAVVVLGVTVWLYLNNRSPVEVARTGIDPAELQACGPARREARGGSDATAVTT
jgi:hypothetical protein